MRDTTGADIIVTIDGGAPDTMYTAEIKDVTGFRAKTDRNGDLVMRLNNVGIADVDVIVAAQDLGSATYHVHVECGTGKG